MLQSQSLSVVTIVIAINVVIGGFSGEDLKWLVHVTVWLKVSDYSQLSDYTLRLQLCRLIRANTAVYAPITFEEIVVVMINYEILYSCI